MLNSWWVWGTGLLGLGGIASVFAFPWLVPMLGALSAALGPLLKGFSELLVWFVKTMWEGIVDIVDNLATIITVISLVAGFSLYYKYYGPERTACEIELAKVVKQSNYWKAKANGR